MAEVGTAYVTILPSTKGFSSKLSGDIGSSGTTAGKTFGSKFGAAALVGGAVAVAAVSKFLSGAVEEARESQKVGALTDAVLKSTGGVANVTAGNVDDLSTALSNQIGVDDELIAAGENMLLTFTNVRNEVGDGNDIFNQATVAASDMAAAFGGDAVSNSKLLGKALNDPIAGMAALTRVGVTFTAQQKEQVKAMVESGDVLGAQKIILGEVTKQTQGAAVSQVTAADKASVAWKNLQESIGTALLPVIDKLATTLTTRVIPAIVSTGKFIGDNKTAFKALGVAIAALTVITAAHAVVMGVTAAGGMLKYLQATKLAQAATKAYAAVQWLLNAALTANPIGIIVVAIAALVAGIIIAYKHSETFRGIVNGLFETLKTFGAYIGGMLLAALGNVASAIVDMGRFGVMAFRLLLQAAFATFDGILAAADKGLGWIPGLGDKISSARTAFDAFGDSVIAKLKGVEDRMRATSAAADKLGQKKVVIEVSYHVNALGQTVGGGGHTLEDGLASGGRVNRRGAVVHIGEGKEPESVLPDSVLRGLLTRTADQARSGRHGGGGVQVHIENMQPHDYQDFMQQSQRRARAAGAAYG